uniref:Uncharacterized protein n=1 Tax=Anguilla anguilla TaxID=7936 RepID=A0A0E9SP24_ANGAN
MNTFFVLFRGFSLKPPCSHRKRSCYNYKFHK